MRRRWLVAVLIVAAACTSDAPGVLLTDVTVDCPAPGPGAPGDGVLAVWPHEAAGDVVPDLASMCESPIATHLLGLFHEEAFWQAERLDAIGLGVLHRSGQALGTFTAVRLDAETARIAPGPSVPGGAETRVGDVELVWHAAGRHVAVEWADGADRVAIAAEGESSAVEIVTAWMEAAGHDETVAPPDEIPELGESYPALEAGPPVGGLPEGYSAIALDPMAFLQSDFAETVEDGGVDALGAAVVVDDRYVIGTLVAGKGAPELGKWRDQLAVNRGVAAAGLTVGDTGAFVVGENRKRVRAFVDEWEKALKG